MRTPAGAENRDLPVLQVLDLARLGEEAGHRRGDELLALATAEDERALLARADQHLGLVEAHRDERVVALELRVRAAHRLTQVAVVVLGDQVRDHLGVGLGAELAAVREQALLERDVVLDDPVDDDVDAVGAVGVRVRVLLGDAAVGGPAGVPDAGRGRPLGDRDSAGVAGELLAQRREVADRPHGVDPLVGDHRDAGGVIAPVFEPREPGQQEVARRTSPDVPNDAAHRSQDKGVCPAFPSFLSRWRHRRPRVGAGGWGYFAVRAR